jgi:DNA recombination protein RmuC
MTLVLAAIQLVLLAIVLVLLLRRREAKDDSRLATELTGQFARLDARLAAVDEHLRGNLAQLRADTSTEAHAGREAAERSAVALRTEVISSVQTLGDTLRSGLNSLRSDNAQ